MFNTKKEETYGRETMLRMERGRHAANMWQIKFWTKEQADYFEYYGRLPDSFVTMYQIPTVMR